MNWLENAGTDLRVFLNSYILMTQNPPPPFISRMRTSKRHTSNKKTSWQDVVYFVAVFLISVRNPTTESCLKLRRKFFFLTKK